MRERGETILMVSRGGRWGEAGVVFLVLHWHGRDGGDDAEVWPGGDDG